MCASAPLFENPVSIFPYARWARHVSALTRRYRENAPIPHVLLKDFLDDETARHAMQEFPTPSTQAWTHYEHQNENKLGMTERGVFPPSLGLVVDELNSPAFADWLSDLTGIGGLLPDSALEGAGLHQSVRGGFLNVHTDFSHHHYRKNWRRRINLILYLNDGWREEWRGAIELWDNQMRHCAAKYPPFFRLLAPRTSPGKVSRCTTTARRTARELRFAPPTIAPGRAMGSGNQPSFGWTSRR